MKSLFWSLAIPLLAVACAPLSWAGERPIVVGSEVLLTTPDAMIHVEPRDDSPDARGFVGCDVLKVTASNGEWLRVALDINALLAKESPRGAVLTTWETARANDFWFDLGWVHKELVVERTAALSYFTQKINVAATSFDYISRACAWDDSGFFEGGEAVADLTTAIGLDSNDGYSFYLRALHYLEHSSDPAGAETGEAVDLEEKTEQDIVREFEERADAAINDLSSAIQRNPNLVFWFSVKRSPWWLAG
jgi:hypothetical protein